MNESNQTNETLHINMEKVKEENINYHEILNILIFKDNTETGNLDEKLELTLQKVQLLLGDDFLKFQCKHDISIDIRYKYVHTIIYVLRSIKVSQQENDDAFISISLLRTFKGALELITYIGIIPCLIPSVGIGIVQFFPKAVKYFQKKISDLEKYDRLTITVDTLVDYYHDIILRPTIIPQLGPLLAALLQLSHAPLIKPSTEDSNESHDHKSAFIMTTDLYNKFKCDQGQYQLKLQFLLENCPQFIIFKELMVILGIKNRPTWLQKITMKYLIDRVIEPNGVLALLSAVFDNTLDIGLHWEKLDTIAKLIASPQGNDLKKYYHSICSQLINILDSKDISHAPLITNIFINALYTINPEVCRNHILKNVMRPLLIVETEFTKQSEQDIDKCIERLTKLFISTEAKFNILSFKVLLEISIPLFCIHCKIAQGAFTLKKRTKQLLLRILDNESLNEDIFAAFLGHHIETKFGSYLKLEFAANGGVIITGIEKDLDYQTFTATLFDLVSQTKSVSIKLFSYLLQYLIKLNQMDKHNKLLETTDDTLQRMQVHLSAVKLLSDLANTTKIQDSVIKNPEPLFSFIKSLFGDYLEKSHTDDENDDTTILYISLMLIKLIISERRPTNWEPFNEFSKFLKKDNKRKISKQLSVLVLEVIKIIDTKGRSERNNFEDLSLDCRLPNKFEEAVKDLGDPLVPVRAHGLITLTKLIEIKDPVAIARKTIILRLFEENLKHDDSFIYLSAINGFCALATSFPQVVLETLVQEYIDMPQRVIDSEFTSETRMKLGEILVKTTRSLGEMTFVHKNLLINGFLCAARDSDPFIRASSLSCLGELCKVLGFRIGHIITEVLYCASCIIKSDKVPECRRAAVLLTTLLLRGLGKDALTELGSNLVELFRSLKYLRDNDDDPVLRLHAQLALEEFDEIVQNFMLTTPKLGKTMFMLNS
ncbi:transport and Golgi organization protein 6 homolog isoform X1 [Prorops nasuta]|uniref:transport and Golgi organization protein 6 homolog isoform X1 n=1 Tax=Prorops nasuta TaxID=863751 RepID=UPI0034CE6B27